MSLPPSQNTFLRPANIQPPPVTFLRERAPVASGWLRFLALFVDGTIQSILITLITSPFHRALTEAKMLGNAKDMWLNGALIFFIGVALFVLYGWITVGLWSATPGMKVFHLKIIDGYSGGPVGFRNAYRRVISFLVCAWIGGFGLIAIFTDPMRRGWHDRFSETLVIKLGTPASQPGWFERVFVYLGFYGAYGVLAFSLILSAVEFRNSKTDDNRLPASMPGFDVVQDNIQKSQCELISLGLTEDGKKPSMDIVLERYIHGAVPETCLGRWADEELTKNSKSLSAYFSKWWLVNSDPAKRASYREKICEIEKDSRPCQVTQFYELKDKNKWDEIRSGLVKFQKEKPDLWSYLVLDLLIADLKFNEALTAIAQLKGGSSDFTQMRILKSYYGLGRVEESQAGVETWFALLEPGDSVGPALFQCATEVMGTCSIKTDACARLESAVGAPKESASPSDRVTLARYYSCQKNTASLEKLGEGAGADFQPVLKAEKSFMNGGFDESIAIYTKASIDPSFSKVAKNFMLLRSSWLLISEKKQFKTGLDFLKQVEIQSAPLSWVTVSRSLVGHLKNAHDEIALKELLAYLSTTNPQDQWVAKLSQEVNRAVASDKGSHK